MLTPEFTVGKHAAPEGGSPHPLVVAARASRASEGGSHREGEERVGSGSEVGWPAAPAPEGGGLGWPADAGKPQAQDTVVRPIRRRGWRRLFGAGRVA